MKTTIRVFAVVSIFAAAACVSSGEQQAQMERARVAAQAAHESIAAMHSSIPASAQGEVFEYASEITMPPAEKVAFAGESDGTVFEYY